MSVEVSSINFHKFLFSSQSSPFGKTKTIQSDIKRRSEINIGLSIS